jgi:hypothetical protein
MMRKPSILAAAALALALAACGTSKKSDNYSALVPDAAAITLETPSTTGGSAQITAQAAAPQDPAAVLTTAGDDLGQVKARAAELNAAIHKIFDRLEEVMASGGDELPGHVKVWGPAVRCVEPGTSGCLAQATLRLRVVEGANDHAGGFTLDARPVSSTDEGAFRPVVAGWLVRGAHERRGVGKVWVNFENLKAAAGAWNGTSGFKGEGYLAAGFAAGPFEKAARYRMLGFTRDSTQHAPVTAAFAGWRSPTGVLRARAVGIGNWDTAGSADELGAWRAVYHPTYGGIAFSAISNYHPLAAPGTVVGDVPTVGAIDHYWFSRACYAAGSTTPAYKEWFYCPTTQGPRACVIAQAGAGTPVITTGAADWQHTTCYSAVEPDAVKAPSLAPLGNPLDDSAEDAETASGVAPQSAPNPSDAPSTAPGG